jgi:hypothetical protein
MRKLLPVTLVLLSFSTLAFSQSDRFWSANNGDRNNIPTDKAVRRLTYPKEFKLFNLNLEPLRQELFSVVDRSSKHSTVITLPNANGELERFEIYEASNFEPDLQAKFPEIRAYSGKGVTDQYATVKLSISPQGIQTMIFRTDKENEFIEPYSNDHRVYSVYRSHRDKGKLAWACTTQEQQLSSEINSAIAGRTEGSSTGQIKTMRLAQSVMENILIGLELQALPRLVWFWLRSMPHLHVVMVFMKKILQYISILLQILQLLFTIIHQQILIQLYQVGINNCKQL